MFDILFACALLASGTTANKLLLRYMPVTFFVGLRMLLSGGILGIWIYPQSQRLRLGYLRQDWIKLLLVSLCTTCLPTLFKAYALKHMPLQKASLLASFDPFVAALYGYILFHEKLGWQKFLGMAVGFSGIVFLLVSSSCSALSSFYCLGLPECAALVSVFISRYGWIMVAQLITKDRYNTYEINSLMMIIGGTLSLFLSLYAGAFSTSFIAEFPVSLWLMLIYTVLIGNICAYSLWSSLFKKYSMSFMSLTGFSISIFSAVYGYFLFHEQLTVQFFVASCIIFLGLLIFYHKENERKQIV